MSNNKIEEDKVKWPSKKRYICKKGKGEHEYLDPTIKYKPSITYIYKTTSGELHSRQINKDGLLIRTEIRIILETRCKNCGHKCVSFLSDKIK
jgi:hypothetical protein